MIETPRITESTIQVAAVLHVTVPREAIRSVMGAGLAEVQAAVAAQGLTSTGPWFTRHFRMDPKVFHFEIGVPIAQPIAPVGRVQRGRLPATRVARTVFYGKYEELPAAWGEFEEWITSNGHTAAPGLWEIYTVGPESSPNPDEWRAELNRPLMD
jgi:effector-binding domain-containing protein